MADYFLKDGQGRFLRMTTGRHQLAQTKEGRAQIVASLPAEKGPYRWTQNVTNAIPVPQSSDIPTDNG